MTAVSLSQAAVVWRQVASHLSSLAVSWLLQLIFFLTEVYFYSSLTEPLRLSKQGEDHFKYLETTQILPEEGSEEKV